MTVRQRILAALRGEMPDQIPLTVYPSMVPRGQAERELRERGLGFAWRASVLDCETPHVEHERREYTENGQRLEVLTAEWEEAATQLENLSRQS